MSWLQLCISFYLRKHWNLAIGLSIRIICSFFLEWICACACQKIFWTRQMMILFASLKMWLMQAILFIAIISQTQITKKSTNKNSTYFWGGVEAVKGTCKLGYDRTRKNGFAFNLDFFCYANTNTYHNKNKKFNPNFRNYLKRYVRYFLKSTRSLV